MSSEPRVPMPPRESLAEAARTGAFAWLLIRGILALIIGLILFIAPVRGGAAVGAFVVASIGVWLIFDGFVTGGLAFRERRASVRGWGWTLFGAVGAIIAGILALIFPFATGVFLGIMVLWFMAAGLFVRGLLELGDRHLGGWNIALGIINMLFGLWLALTVFVAPGEALFTLAWVGGIYGIVFGIASIVAAVQIRKAA